MSEPPGAVKQRKLTAGASRLEALDLAKKITHKPCYFKGPGPTKFVCVCVCVFFVFFLGGVWPNDLGTAPIQYQSTIGLLLRAFFCIHMMKLLNCY